MSHNRSLTNEQRNIEITYFKSPPPPVVYRASTVDLYDLTPDEYGAAMSFSMKHGERLVFQSEITNDEIIDLVKELGGQGPIIVSSVYNYTIETSRKASPLKPTSLKG